MTKITSFQIVACEESFESLFRTLFESAESPRFLWAESADAWSFHAWSGIEDECRLCRAGQSGDGRPVLAGQWLPQTEAGRLFCAQRELRWRRLASGPDAPVRMVLLDDDPTGHETLANNALVQELETTTAGDLGLARGRVEEKFILWGRQTKRAPGEWIELSIPHRFRYPWADTGTAPPILALRGVRWFDAMGQTHFMQMTGLTSADAKTVAEEKDEDNDEALE